MCGLKGCWEWENASFRFAIRILVLVKWVVDYNAKIRIELDGSSVDLANVKMSMNPFDEIAVGEALRQKEAGKATEVVIDSIGSAEAAETIHTALAMGADRGASSPSIASDCRE
jgi:electron transfer flavoprotein beta subunit